MINKDHSNGSEMKNRFAITIILNLLMSASLLAFEGGIATKSRALFEVISAIEAARYDLPVSYEVVDNEMSFNGSDCFVVDAGAVVLAFEEMLEAYQVVFPDDELPYSAAIEDFSALVGASDYLQCESQSDEDREIVKTVSFKSLGSSFKVAFLHHVFK